MDDEEVLARVRAHRARGLTPKQVARSLGLSPSVAARLVRQAAGEREATAPERPVVGCWISPGWSEGLTVPAGWPDVPTPDGIGHGLATVLLAREHRHHTVSVSCFLVDVYCLGVKNAFGPKVKHSADLPAVVRETFDAYLGSPLPVAIEMAREVVWGAVAYAGGLGFEPHPDFEPAAAHLGPVHPGPVHPGPVHPGPVHPGHCVPSGDLTFGLHGKPYFVHGPRDNAGQVMRTLNRAVGKGNYHFLVPVGSR